MSAPVAHLSRRYHLSASHRLHIDSLSPEQNFAIFGKCNNPFGHGHNYVIQVTLSGPVDSTTGMVTNLADLDSFAQRNLLDLFDHANLNMLSPFRDQVSTTENLARVVWRIFIEFPYATLRHVHIEETANNSIDYFGNEAQIVGQRS